MSNSIILSDCKRKGHLEKKDIPLFHCLKRYHIFGNGLD